MQRQQKTFYQKRGHGNKLLEPREQVSRLKICIIRVWGKNDNWHTKFFQLTWTTYRIKVSTNEKNLDQSKTLLDINIFTCNSSFHWHWSIHPGRGCNIQHSYELEDHHDLQLNTGGRSALLQQLQIWKIKNKSHVFKWANCNHKISICFEVLRPVHDNHFKPSNLVVFCAVKIFLLIKFTSIFHENYQQISW